MRDGERRGEKVFSRLPIVVEHSCRLGFDYRPRGSSIIVRQCTRSGRSEAAGSNIQYCYRAIASAKDERSPEVASLDRRSCSCLLGDPCLPVSPDH